MRKMTSSKMITLTLTVLLLGELVPLLSTRQFSAIRQDSGLKSVDVGNTVTLNCFYEGDISTVFSWYKQILGNKPVLVSNFFKYDKNSTFYNEFQGDPRFTVQSGKGTHHLLISALKRSDSATYYCVSGYTSIMEFGEGTFLNVNDPEFNIKTIVQQPVSESVQPGDSVTLNCTIHTETCAGEHSVYWFRHGSDESHPGIIYTHGDRSDQCEKSPEAGSPTQSCVYNLPKRNLSLSDAGTYYCAVASCGEMLFGDGTRLDVEDVDEVVAAQVRILVVLSVMRTGVLLCCLFIFTILYFIKK